MDKYQTKVQRFEEYELDDPDDPESDSHFAGYLVFSTVYVGLQTQVRTVKPNQAAMPSEKEWWVEYCFQINGCEVRANLTKHNLTYAAAIRKAESMAELISRRTFETTEFAIEWISQYSTPNK